MQLLMYALFAAVFSMDSLNRYGLVERYMTWLPELFSLVAILVVIYLAVRDKSLYANIGYYVIFSLLLLHMFFGVILNTVPTGAIFGAIRDYFKYIPFFFLPVVYEFKAHDIQRQLLFILFLSLAQLPFAMYQLFIESAGLTTADLVGGTIGTSGHLSIYLVCVAAIWLAFYFRSERRRPLLFWVVLVLVLAPTTMNLSKGTLFLAPVAMLVPAILDYKAQGRFKHLFVSLLVLAVFSALFIPIYDAVYNRGGMKGNDYELMTFLTTEEKVRDYLIRSESADEGKAGKIGGLIVAYKELSTDPIKHFFGLGIGNLSKSFLGKDFAGEYLDQYGGLGGATVGALMWEIGWFGVLLIFILCFLIYRDAVYVKASGGIIGAFALGWATVVLIMVLAFFYKDVTRVNVLGYLFWFYSGYIVTVSARMRAAQTSQWRNGEGGWSSRPDEDTKDDLSNGHPMYSEDSRFKRA